MTKTNTTDTMNTFEKVAARDALTLQPKMKTVTMWALVWNGRTSLKLYTKVQINRMVKNMAKRGVFAYGSMLKVNCWVHTDGRVTYQSPKLQSARSLQEIMRATADLV